MTKDQAENFLRDLLKLCQEYNVNLGGCNCFETINVCNNLNNVEVTLEKATGDYWERDEDNREITFHEELEIVNVNTYIYR